MQSAQSQITAADRAWQAEADLLADGRAVLEKLSGSWRYRHLYPRGANLALLLGAYRDLDRRRAVLRMGPGEPRAARRFLARRIRRRFRRDALARDGRLLWSYPEARLTAVSADAPTVVQRALASVDSDARVDVEDLTLHGRAIGPATDQSMIDPRHTEERIARGLRQFRAALINEALSHPQSIGALHPQFVALATSDLPSRRRHPITALILVKLPLYFWMSLFLLFNAAYLAAFVFFNEHVMGRFVSGKVSSILQGELEIESIYWRPRLIVDLVTGQPTPLVAEGVRVYEPYKGLVDERGRTAARADRLDVSLVLHEIIPWNRLGIPRLFDIPWILHFGQVTGEDPVVLDVRHYGTSTDGGESVEILGLRDAFLLWDFESNPAARGLSVHVDDARLRRVDLDVDERELSVWSAGLELRDAQFGLWFDAPDPAKSRPEGIPFRFSLTGAAPGGAFTIGDLRFKLQDGQLGRFVNGLNEVPDGDVAFDVTTRVDGSPVHLSGALLHALTYGDSAPPRSADVRAETDDVGRLARSLLDQLGLPDVKLEAENRPARAHIGGPLADPTFRIWLDGIGVDALHEPAWVTDDVQAAISIRHRQVEAAHRSPSVGPNDLRWVFTFDTLSGSALDGEFSLLPDTKGVAVLPALPLEPYVVAAPLTVSSLNPAQLSPDDPALAATLAGGADGQVTVRRLEFVDHREDEDTLRAELEFHPLRVRRDRGPSDDSLPRRIRVDGDLTVDHDGSMDTSGLRISVDGGYLEARGGASADLKTLEPSSLSVDVADGKTFMAAFGWSPYFEVLEAKLSASGPLARLSGQGGRLAVTGLGHGQLGRTEVTSAQIWIERGTLHLRSPNAQAFGGRGTIDLDVHLTDGRHFREDPLVRGTIDLDGVSLAQLAGDDFEGRADMRIDVDDGDGKPVPLSQLRARAAVYAQSISYRGNTFAGVTANLDVDPNRISIERLTLPFHRSVSPFHAPDVTVPMGQVDVTGTISLAEDPALDLEVVAAGVPLGLLEEFLNQDIPVRAQIARGTRLRVGGTVRRPGAEGTIALAGIHAGGIPLGHGEMDVSSRDLDRDGPLAPHRELRITGEFSGGKRDVDWTLDAVVALSTGRDAEVAAQAHIFVDRLSLDRLVSSPNTNARTAQIDGALEGLAADALTCNPGPAMLSDCLAQTATEQSLQVELELQRAWIRDRHESGNIKDPCNDPHALCTRGNLVAEVDWPMVRLKQPWRIGAGGPGASTLAVVGEFDLSEPPPAPATRGCNEISAGGRSRGQLEGAIELTALRPLLRASGIDPSGGTLAVDLALSGFVFDPAVRGHVLLPPETDAIRLNLFDGAVPIELRNVAIEVDGRTLLARAGVGSHGQTLQVGQLGRSGTSYTYAGPCVGEFTLAASGAVSGRVLDALAGDRLSVRGTLGVDRVILSGTSRDTIALRRAEAQLQLDAAHALEIEGDIGLEPIRSRAGRVELQMCTPTHPCPGPRTNESIAVFVGGRGAVRRSVPPTQALDLAIGDRGRARAWGQVYVSPDLSGVDDTQVSILLDEVTYRTHDRRGRPELEAEVSTPQLVIEGSDPLFVRGRVDVERSRWLKDALENVGLLDFLSDDVEAPEAPPPEFVRNLQLALDLRSSSPLRVDNNIASGVEARFAARISGSYGAPEVQGRVDVEPGGQVQLPLVSGTFEIQQGRILLERDLETAKLDLLAQREEPVYVDGQARQFSVRLLGPLNGIRWECDTGAVAQDEVTTARACIDYLVFGAGDVQVSDADVRRSGSGGLLHARKGLEVVGNVAELDVSQQLTESVPRTEAYLPDISLRLGQIGPELELETPRDWFDFDYGRASFGIGYTRGYPGFLLRSNRELAVRLELLDPFTLEMRSSRRSYLNERIIFDPLQRQSVEAALEFELPSLR